MQVNCNPTQQLLFCIHLSHAFCRMRTPLSILPLSSQARKHSNHHTYRTPHRQVCTCLSHLSAVCKPGSRGIIFLDVAICLSIRTCLASELCVPTCQLCLPPSPSHTSPGALFLLHYVLSSQPSAFLPSHFTEQKIKFTTSLCPRAGGWVRVVSVHLVMLVATRHFRKCPLPRLSTYLYMTAHVPFAQMSDFGNREIWLM